MKNLGRNPILSFGSLLFAAAWLLTATAQAASPGAAQVKKVSGTATYTDAKGGGPLKEGDILLQGASITTGAGSYVDLFLGVNGDALRVEADSTLALNKLDYTKAGETIVNTQLEVKKGAAVANVINKLSKASKYEIKSPAGVAGIRGTVVRVTTSRVVCLIGRVEFVPVGNGKLQLVIGGTVFAAGATGPVKATAVETTAVAVAATSCTANTQAASVVSQAVQQFTTVIAADAASGAGVAGASKAAADAAKATMLALLAAVKEAADNAPPEIRTAAQAAVAALVQRSEVIQATSAAGGAARGTLDAGGSLAAAKANAAAAADQSTTNPNILTVAKIQGNTAAVVGQQSISQGGDARGTVNGAPVGVVTTTTPTPVIIPPPNFVSPVVGGTTPPPTQP